MEGISFYENLFIKADALISEGNISEGKEILEDILTQYPDFAKAHNHLGWIHYNKLSDYDKGIYHYNLAIKFNPKYPAAYLNLAYLLIDIGRYKEAKNHIDFTFKNLENIDTCSLNNELGRIAECELDYIKAHKYYNIAKSQALNQQFIENMEQNCKRIKKKMSIFDKIKLLFN